ncbi:hypothetical protein HPB51_025936 [Rhipicephalus microplus]|uniref:Uncharacterized protein n=1 Tax=Rhipicephalus microplus TaxID=6941 RepID=A0A9J6EDB9_RHIMP|nr:hypothetical protein HPB51_025936 [Rhipicephalus microplus]
MCRILRSEAWRQVRFYTDCLQFLNRNELPYPSAQKKFIEDLRLASQTADFLWGNILVQLPRSKRRNYVPSQDVLVLGEASIPNNVADLLRLGPKYCEHPDLDKTELLSLVRTAAGKASMDESDRCVREGVDCLPQRVKKGNSAKLRTMVTSLREAGLKLLLSDKEGGFVVLPRSLYKEKAAAAILENFNEVKGVVPAKVKTRAVQLCEEAGLAKLAKSVKACKETCLSAFFSAKTHKELCPFRTIVSERGTWQREVGVFLQRFLGLLDVDDPYLIRAPGTVSTFLQDECPEGVRAFSIDIKDLYYSLPQEEVKVRKADLDLDIPELEQGAKLAIAEAGTEEAASGLRALCISNPLASTGDAPSADNVIAEPQNQCTDDNDSTSSDNSSWSDDESDSSDSTSDSSSELDSDDDEIVAVGASCRGGAAPGCESLSVTSNSDSDSDDGSSSEGVDLLLVKDTEPEKCRS